MKQIEKLLLTRPNLDVVESTNVFIDLDTESAEEIGNAKELIEDYYDGFPAFKSDPSGNPELEQEFTLTGADYIEEVFEGNYYQAFMSILAGRRAA